MPLQKTGWRIKHLICQRKNDGNPTGSEDASFEVGKGSAGLPKRVSWSLQNPANADITLLRRTSSNAATRTPHISPRNPNRTSHSSTSSLCSCDCDCDSTQNAGPLSSSRRRLPEALYSSTTTSDNGRSRINFFSDQRSLSRLDTKLSSKTTIPPIAAGTTLHVLEAITTNPVDDTNTPTRSLGHMEEQNTGDLSLDVEQLIRETDEAFRAVGAALADAKAPAEGWHDSRPSVSNTTTPPGIPKEQASIQTLPLIILPLEAAMAIPASEPKVKPLKRVKSAKKHKKLLLNKPVRPIQHPPFNTPSRWKLNEVSSNMANVFSVKRFRIEVDEMLTPDRIQQMKNSIKIEHERRMSVESTKSVDTESSTPIEPFHLESLSNRITAAQKRQFTPSPTRTPPDVPADPTRNTTKNKMEEHTMEAGMVFNNVTFPTPPRTPRRSPASRNTPLLPTILEHQSCSNMIAKASLYGVQPQQTYILLPSTRYTLVAPLFRQGPIRIEPLLQRRRELVPEEEPLQLDWTAFQMAISGMGEAMIEDDWEDDEAGLNEILSWWRGYGFEGYGRMDRSEPAPPTHGDLLPALLVAKKLLEAPPTNRTNTQEISSIQRQSREETDTRKIPKETRQLSDAQKRISLTESMPPSPMLDLVLPSPSRDGEVIPMGFNLGHDLGDFLNWETHHVQTLVYR